MRSRELEDMLWARMSCCISAKQKARAACLGAGGQVTESTRPEHLRSRTSCGWECQGQLSPTGNSLPQGTLGISKSLPPGESVCVSRGAETVQRMG